MALWLKILIVILALHYLLAIAILFFVLKDNLRVGIKISRVKLICWNLIVLFVPIIGPLAYLIYRLIARPQNTSIANISTTLNTTENTDTLDSNPTQNNDETTKTLTVDTGNKTISTLPAETDKNTKINDEDN